MIILLHPEQATEVALLSVELNLTPDEVVAFLLTGPLLPTPGMLEEIPLPS
jgi:hypothetical protein